MTTPHPVPAGACDCHTHVFGRPEEYPLSPDRAYTPGPATAEQLLDLQRRLGLDRVVLVQPSTYGTDNACMLDGLRRLGPARARGVAVIDDATPDITLREMDAAGVRGVRLNLHTAGRDDPEAARTLLVKTARRIAPLGWHVQVYTDLSVIAALHDDALALPTDLVVDHFGRAEGRLGPSQPGFEALLSLVRAGRAYVKLSAAHRLSDAPDSEDMAPIARALIAANPARMLWATDWPHSGTTGRGASRLEVSPFDVVDDQRSLARLGEWTDAATFRQILVENPSRVYGF
ncbi:amidohydrolase family protein [Muricoccus radiodurans]|uniref:amidohydrolase family protein n=1 Tax=Muricoccus radiodurans TaxID=2231721 RepID=UPI003CF05A90